MAASAASSVASMAASMAASAASSVGATNTKHSDGSWTINIKDKKGNVISTITIPVDKIYTTPASKKNYISVSHLVEILKGYTDFKDYFYYFVHCRGVLNKIKRSSKFKFSEPIENDKKVDNPFLLVQAHGTTRVNDRLDYDISPDVLDKILFRANLGYLCRRHSSKNRFYVYEKAMAHYAEGKLRKKPIMTNDLLELDTMEIVLASYDSSKFNSEYVNFGTQGEPEESPEESPYQSTHQSLEQSPYVIPEKRARLTKGGTVKRKRRKRKTRKR